MLAIRHSPRAGYSWQKGKIQRKKPVAEQSVSEIRLLLSFLQRYSWAVDLEDQGKAVLVYTDESYCDTAYGSDFSWSQAHGNALCRRVVKSTRLIILHAMTKHGLLAATDEQTGAAIMPAMYQSGPFLNAELIFTGKETGDYHQNMNAVSGQCCFRRLTRGHRAARTGHIP